MDRPLRVLLVDDDRDDYLLTRDLLRDAMGERFALEWTESYDEGLAALAQKKHDVCLLDYRLGSKTGLELLRDAAEFRDHAPIILLTGQGQVEIDMQAMEAGAADFLTKDQLRADSLERAMRHALERHRDRLALNRLNELLESRVEQRTRELETANQALREADRRKDEFLAVLAHELRNPLAPISNALGVLRQADDDVALFRQMHGTIERQLKQLVRLTEDLLEVSRISQGKIVLRMEPVEVASVIEQAVEAARPMIDERRQILTVHLPPQGLRVQADPARLAQVVGNLLNNASKFTGEKGRIELSVVRQEDRVLIAVRDDGIGIAADELERIFELFTQVDASLERSQTGLGIGLTLVRKLVQMHGGTVLARSAGRGHGSEFVITLPCGVEDDARPAVPLSPAQTVSRRCVLVVDDNRDSATTMAMLLKLAGHDVATAFGGIEAIEQVHKMRPQVVLLDIGLPDINGYEVARRLRQASNGDSLMLVALTGWGQDEDRRRALEAGFDHHLLKPVEYATLTQLLAQVPSAG